MKKKILAALLVTVSAISAAQATLQPFSSSAFSLASDGFSWIGGALSGAVGPGNATRRADDTGQDNRPPGHWARAAQSVGSPAGHHGGGVPSTLPRHGLALPDPVTTSLLPPDTRPGLVNLHAPSFADTLGGHASQPRPLVAFSSAPTGGSSGGAGGPAFTPLRLPDQGLVPRADDKAIAPVPEPATYALLLSGLGLVALGRRTRQKSA